jgi:hypothetical protein
MRMQLVLQHKYTGQYFRCFLDPVDLKNAIKLCIDRKTMPIQVRKLLHNCIRMGLWDKLHIHIVKTRGQHSHLTLTLLDHRKEDTIHVPIHHKQRISYSDWFVQLVIWNVIVFGIKVLVFYLEYALSGPLITVSDFILSWIDQFETL